MWLKIREDVRHHSEDILDLAGFPVEGAHLSSGPGNFSAEVRSTFFSNVLKR
jgi:hypothetical protein